MKIGITTTGPDLDADVAERFGTAGYFVIFDSETGHVEGVANPGASGSAQSGIQAVIFAIGRRLDVVLTGYLSPTAEKHLHQNGVRVVRGAAGSARKALNAFTEESRGLAQRGLGDRVARASPAGMIRLALKSSIRQFSRGIPIMLGVVLLIGLFHAFVEKETLLTLFSGEAFRDTLWGACAGSLFAGNPINSYIIGGEFLRAGIGLTAVTAFMVAWVSVGLIQLPAEMEALGKRFALTRNGLSFLLSLAAAFCTVTVLTWMGG